MGIKRYSITVLRTVLCGKIKLRVEKVYYNNFLKSRISAPVHYKGTSEVFCDQLGISTIKWGRVLTRIC